jgi:hypothetical protein
MLPLTYFNLLVLAGFLLMATALVPVAPHGRDRAPAQP